MATTIKKAAVKKTEAPKAAATPKAAVPTAKKAISKEDCILAALPGVMRRSSLEDPKGIADLAITIGTALFNGL